VQTNLDRLDKQWNKEEAPAASASAILRDQALLEALAVHSWYMLRSNANTYHLPIPDLWLADRAMSFYPSLMDQLKLTEPAAHKAQMQDDVYNFCAKLTSMPGEMWLPLDRPATLLCSVWKQQLSGVALHLTVADPNDQMFRAEVLDIMQHHGVFHRRFYGHERVELRLVDLQNQTDAHTRGKNEVERWTDVAQLALHAGVRESCTLQLLWHRSCAAPAAHS